MSVSKATAPLTARHSSSASISRLHGNIGAGKLQARGLLSVVTHSKQASWTFHANRAQEPVVLVEMSGIRVD